MTRYVVPGEPGEFVPGPWIEEDVPQPGRPTMNLLEPHPPSWLERRRARRRPPAPLGPCCPTHTEVRWHYFAHDCQGCGCPADGHSLILLGHPCLDCADCPAYIPVWRPDPSR